MEEEKEYYKGLTKEQFFNPKTYTKKQTNLLLEGILQKKAHKIWWEGARPQELEGRTPFDAWAEGDKKKVYELVVSYHDGAYS